MDARPERLVLELGRLLDAAPSRIFTALTDPADLASWWGPAGFTVPDIELDLRVGGRYRFGMQPPDADLFHLTGVFRVLEPPGRLAYSFRWEEPDPDDRETLVELTLEDAGGRTALALRQGEFATAARLELHRAGWSDSLAKLQELLEPG
jgi:uncharacterized protein YndB with AHSA1/START domain